MLDLDLPEIQEVDLNKIIRAKLLAATKAHDGDLIVEDVSLEFAAIAPLPGPLIKWFLKTMGNQGLYDFAEKLDSQKAINKVMIGYYKAASQQMHFFESSFPGMIVAPRGNLDFGWGPNFQPEGSQKTYGEMEKSEKEKFSPRFAALKKLQEYLNAG